MGDEGTDEHGRLSLSDERRGSSYNGLGTGDAHEPEEECGGLDDEPLQDIEVVQELDQGNEEDDGWDNGDKEPARGWDGTGGQKDDSVICETEEVPGSLGDEVEDIVTGLGSENEEGNDELRQHAHDNCVPDNLLTVPRGSPQCEEEDDQSEETNSAVIASIVCRFARHKCANKDDCDCHECSARNPELLGDKSD